MPSRPPRRRVILAELERRSVFRVSAVYGAASFVMLEALRLWAPELGIVEPVPDAVAMLTLLGYPIALWLAWHFELTGDGMDRTDDATSGELRERVGKPRIRRWAPTILGFIGILLLAASALQILLA